VSGDPVSADGGSICVASIPKNIKELDDTIFGSPRGRNYTYSFSVQVDDHPPRSLVLGASTLIADLHLEKRHIVRIRDGRKTIETFAFTFKARGGPHLCLSYGAGYQTWSLEVPTRGQHWCRCKAGQ
jgi:hypothetical protein